MHTCAYGSAFLPTFTFSPSSFTNIHFQPIKFLELDGLKVSVGKNTDLYAQVFDVVAGEKFSVDIDNSAIDCTLDQFYFI